MRVLYLIGKDFNMVARAQTITPGSVDAVLGDVSAIHKLLSPQPFLFDVGTDNDIVIDMTQVDNGTFEAAFVGGVPGDGWNAGDATIARDTGNVIPGSTGALSVAGGSGKRCYVDIVVPAGKTMRIGVHAKGTCEAQLQCLTTGRYLTAAGTWAAAATAWAVSAATYVYTAVSFAVEDYATCGRDEVTLRAYFRAAAAGTHYFDDFAIWPHINFASIHYHRSYPEEGGTILLEAGDGVSFASVGTFDIVHPSTFLLLTSRTEQVYKLTFPKERADGEAYGLGKFVLGEYRELAEAIPDELGLGLMELQDRPEGLPGQTYLQEERRRRRRSLSLLMQNGIAAEVTEILERSRNGGRPSLFVTDVDDSSSAMLCRIAEAAVEIAYEQPGLKRVTLTLDEFPFPRIVP